MTQEEMGVQQKLARRGFSAIFLVFLGFVSVVAGSLAPRGNGLPPVLYFFFGAVVLPTIARTIGKRFTAARRVQLVVLLLGAGACSAAAYLSSRQSPEVIFEHVFNAPPPASVTELRGRKQWFDGQIWLVECKMSDAAFQTLLPGTRVRIDEAQATAGDDLDWQRTKWAISIGQWGAIAYHFLSREAPSTPLVYYEWTNPTPDPDIDSLQIARDPVSQRVWAVRLD